MQGFPDAVSADKIFYINELIDLVLGRDIQVYPQNLFMGIKNALPA